MRTTASQTTIGTTRTPTSRPQSRTPMTTLTSTIAWRACTESARTAYLFHSCDCLTLHIHGSSSERIHSHPRSHSWAHLFDSFLRFLLLPSPPVCPPSSSSTSSCSLSSTTRSSWQTCAAPLQKRHTVGAWPVVWSCPCRARPSLVLPYAEFVGAEMVSGHPERLDLSHRL